MRVKLIKREVDSAEKGERDRFIWDTELKGFGLKITSAGRKVYVLQYRMGGRGTRVRRYTIGEPGAFTPDQARHEAEKLRGDIRKGIDPALAKQRVMAD